MYDPPQDLTSSEQPTTEPPAATWPLPPVDAPRTPPAAEPRPASAYHPADDTRPLERADAVPATRPVAWAQLVMVAFVSAVFAGLISLALFLALDEDPAPPADAAPVVQPTVAQGDVDADPPADSGQDATLGESPTTGALPLAGTDVIEAVEVGNAVIPSVVTVQVGGDGGNGFFASGSGSGVVLDAEGYIITNHHVIDVADTFQVILSDKRVYPATLIGSDPLTDLAVLRIDAPDLEPIALGATSDLSVGDVAIAVGSPLGLEGGPSLTVGVVSAFGRQVQTGPQDILYGMLQTDAPITQGSSGGALVNADGELIGITTAVGVSSVGVEGIGFATPVELVERVTTELIATGSIDHAFLGITGFTEFADSGDGGSVPAGVSIQSVESGSAADTSGLEAGDLITSIDGEQVVTMDDLIVALRHRMAGSEVTLLIDRDGVRQSIALVLGSR